MSSGELWMGLSRDGEPRQITHAELMQWAYRNEQQFTVGWSNHYTDPKGTRLVRGDHVAEARKQGWNDLADRLEQHFKEQGHG